MTYVSETLVRDVLDTLGDARAADLRTLALGLTLADGPAATCRSSRM